jgi:t-SNARE complex subunit (syntaxin)
MSDYDFNRLDKTINRVDEALTRITILEERFQQNSRTLERAFDNIDSLKADMQEVEKSQAINQTKIGFNERIVWVFISGLIGIASYFMRS